MICCSSIRIINWLHFLCGVIKQDFNLGQLTVVAVLRIVEDYSVLSICCYRCLGIIYMKPCGHVCLCFFSEQFTIQMSLTVTSKSQITKNLDQNCSFRILDIR